MKVIKNNREDNKLYQQTLDKFIPELIVERSKNRKKILEVCHAAKFITFFDNQLSIEKLQEKPDFILVDQSHNMIGLELQRIIDPNSKEREGFFENICLAIECEMESDPQIPNFLVNCDINPDFNYKVNQKKNISFMIRTVVEKFVLENNFVDNPLVERISKMPHTHKNICPNFGAWMQKSITPDILKKAILKKEKLVKSYRSSGINKQWLLLVIGGIGESSYDFRDKFEVKVNTSFDKIFLLEDFNSILYQLK